MISSRLSNHKVKTACRNSSAKKTFANTTKMGFASLEKIAREIITIKFVKINLIAEKMNASKDIQKNAKTLRLMVNVDIKNAVHTSM